MSGARTGGGEGEQLREIKVGGEVQAPPGGYPVVRGSGLRFDVKERERVP